MKQNDLDQAHNHSFKSKEEILASKECGCCYCLKIFSPKEISEWADNGETAICPFCHIDAVIGDKSGFPITQESLKEMNNYWF